jgi:hypothetical protein
MRTVKALVPAALACLLACGDATSPDGPAEGTWNGLAAGAAIEIRLFDRDHGQLAGFGSVTPANNSGLPALIDPSLTGVRIQDSVHVVLGDGNRAAFVDGRIAGSVITGTVLGTAPFRAQGTSITLSKQPELPR